MMRYLTDNFTHLKRNNSKQLIISTIGFIINVLVAFLWREAYQKELKEEIISKMTGAEMQKNQVARGVNKESNLEFMLDILTKSKVLEIRKE